MALLFWQLGSTTAQTATLDFFYDAQGNPYAVKYNGTLYYYITNLQGDVLHIVDTSGNTVVSYTYSPYGKPLTTTGTLASTLGATGTLASTLGAANPLRYRGYYFDSDSGLYYLQSRYYDPEIGRFLNADSYASTGQGILGCNMFAYCNNNPVMYGDFSGSFPWLVVGIIVISAVVGAIWGATSDTKLGEPESPEDDYTQTPSLPPSPSSMSSQNNTGSPIRNNSNMLPKDATCVMFQSDEQPLLPNKTNVSNKESSDELTIKDRINNAFIGASLGLMAGGGILIFGGAAASLMVGSATTTIGVLGMTGMQTVAWGALSYNVFPMIFAPFYGIEMEVIELEP